MGEISIPETYSPTVGMSNVTEANENILINFSATASGANLQFFSVEPATPLRVTLKRGDAVLFNEAVTADPKNGNRISAAIPAGGSSEQVRLTIRTADGKELIAAETRIKMIIACWIYPGTVVTRRCRHPRKAGDPVFQRRRLSRREAAAYWIPAFAGMTIV